MIDDSRQKYNIVNPVSDKGCRFSIYPRSGSIYKDITGGTLRWGNPLYSTTQILLQLWSKLP